MSDLKPCPFCGGDVQLYNIDDDGLGGFSYYYEVVCRHCGLSNKSIYADRDRVENAAIKHWNTRPIEDALRKEISQLQADNISLVEQMNQMALKPNQEVIEWHNYPEEKPERPVGTLVPNPVSQLSLLVEYQTIDGGTYVCTDEYYWLNEPGFGLEIDVTVLAWAYMPKGENHEQEI